MSDVNVGVGAKLDPNFKGSLHDAVTAVREMAEEIQNPLASVAAGAKVADVAFDYLKDSVKEAILGPLGALLVSAGAVEGAMWLLDKADRSVAAGLREFSNVQDLQAQFRPLLGSIAEAKARLEELKAFSDVTPYQLNDVAAASKMLQVLTGGALSTGEGLRKVGDAAAFSGGNLQDVAMQIGRLYDDLQNGRPMGLAGRRLEELGLLSGKTRIEIEKLQKEGKTGAQVWDVFSQELDKSKGSMAALSQTINGLNSTYADAKAAVGRAVGEGFAQTEMDSVKAATEVTKNFIPIAKEASQVANSFGFADWPSMWFPLFDVQAKKFLAGVLAAKQAWIAFINVLAVAGIGLTASLIATVVNNIRSWVTWARNAAAASKAWAAAQKELVLSTELSTDALKANIVALTENGAAALRARAVMLLQAGAAGIMRMALEKLATVFKDLGRAMISPIGLLITAAAALYSYYDHVQHYIDQVKELGAATVDRVNQIHTERDAIVTVQDKIDALTKAYGRLKEQQDAVTAATDDATRAFAQKGVDAIRSQIGATEAIDPTQLKPSPARQAMIDAHDINNPLVTDQLERELSVKARLAFLEMQRNDLLNKWVDLQKKADDATAAASPQQIAAIDAQIADKQKQLDESKLRMADAEMKYGARRGAQKYLGKLRTEENGLQDTLQKQIADLEAAKAGVDSAYETAQTNLQDINDKLDVNSTKQLAAKRESDAEDRAYTKRMDELMLEQKIDQLKSKGLQRTLDEGKLRQDLAAKQFAEADAAHDTEGRMEAVNKYLEEQLKITDAQIEAQRQLQDIEAQRLDKLAGLIGKLPKTMQIPFLEKEKTTYDRQAQNLDAEAWKARDSGDVVRAAQLAAQADDVRDKASDIAETIRKAINNSPIPQVDSMQKIAGGGRIAHTAANSMPDKVAGIHDIVARIENILKSQGYSNQQFIRIVPR